MESLLHWSIANSEPNAPPPDPERLKAIDPAIIDHILGKSDAVLMQESLEKALDEQRPEDDRVIALDDLEMLVESLDNANNLNPLNMWTPLLRLLTTTSSDPIRTQVLWIFGTAVQNNPKAQSDFLSQNPVPLLLSCLDPTSSNDSSTRSKAIYALSSTLKHSSAALDEFTRNDGWAVLERCLIDSDVSVRRKTAFLISSLLLPTSTTFVTTPFPNDPNPPPSSTSTVPQTLAALKASKPALLQTIIAELCSPTPHGINGDQEPDIDSQEKLAKCIVNYLNAGGDLDVGQRKAVGQVVQKHNTDQLGLDNVEWGVLLKACPS